MPSTGPLRNPKGSFPGAEKYVSELTVHLLLEKGLPASHQLPNFPLNLTPKVESWKVRWKAGKLGGKLGSKWKADVLAGSHEGLIITLPTHGNKNATN